jgi:hypothetical protein
MRIKLTTKQTSFEALHQALDGRKNTMVRIRRSDLEPLLSDHSRMVAALQDQGVQIVEPFDEDFRYSPTTIADKKKRSRIHLEDEEGTRKRVRL